MERRDWNRDSETNIYKKSLSDLIVQNALEKILKLLYSPFESNDWQILTKTLVNSGNVCDFV